MYPLMGFLFQKRNGEIELLFLLIANKGLTGGVLSSAFEVLFRSQPKIWKLMETTK